MPKDKYTDANIRLLSERKGRCATCVFFDEDVGTPQPDDGHCQIRTPFVPKQADDWCGDYHPRRHGN